MGFIRPITPLIGLPKLKKYCAYQERCHQEVRNKGLSIGLFGDSLEEVIYDLIQEGFLNEERFAISYARGKQRIKRWGRIRIKIELKKRNISNYCIEQAIEQLDEDDYLQGLKIQIQKARNLGKESSFDIINYVLSKGYEIELIKENLED